MKKLTCWLGALVLFVCSAAFTQDPNWTVLGQRWWAHVRFLADDSLEGRETGSLGFEKAAAYVAGQFRAAGLQPAGSDGYLQHVDFNAVKIDEARCSLELVRDAAVQPVKLGKTPPSW